MKIQKYYNIKDVSVMLNIPQHSLRYMDKILGSSLTRIRGRRYYSLENIESIKELLSPKNTDKDLDKKLLTSIDSIIISLKQSRSMLQQL